MKARILFFIILFSALFSAAPAFAINIIEGAPAGFEQLDQPRQTAVNLYFGGEILGPVPAHFTPGTLQFDQPDAVIAAIPTISDKVKIKEALSHPLSSNPQLLCTERRTENCGKLSPEVAGVIFDENHLSAELFINKNYLSVVSNETRYLPLPSDHKLSSVYGFSGAVNGTGLQQTPTFTVTNNTVSSVGEAQLISQSTMSNNGLRFDTMAAGADRKGFQVEAGLLRSKSMQLISDHDMAGVSFSTSSRTRIDDHKNEGNDIILYLARRSFVSIYREGRLYSSRSYEAGNQKIDTSELPEGAYTITLRIQEADGATHEETRFFAKTAELPPKDQPTYYFQAGLIRKSADMAPDALVPEVTGNPLLRTGIVKRINDDMAFSAGFLGLEDRLIMEDGIFWIHGGNKISAEILTSTHGDYGFHAGWIAMMEKWSAGIDVRKVWTSHVMQAYSDLVQNVGQASASLSYTVNTKINLGLRTDYSQQQSAASTLSVGPYMEWHIWQEGENTLSLTANAARTQSRDEESVMVSFIHRFGNYGISGTAGMGAGGDSKGETGSARVWHDDPTPGNSLLVGAGITAERQNQIVNADADLKNNLGQLHGSVQDSFGQNGGAIGYGGSFSVNAAQLGADEIHLGGSQTDQSAVIIETDGDVDADMKIFVGGSEKSSVKVGNSLAVYLSPFHTYNIRLAPAKSGLLDYDSAARQITLYPGNVVKMKWSVNKFYVVTGHIVTETGQPLANALLEGTKDQISTDENGRIQAEISKPQLLTFAYGENNSQKCRVTVPDSVSPVNGILIYREVLTCVAVGELGK